tara:strand:+ start:660 stop:1748 length:1089 start_codon:yes stop_codon:yes gene_type:complete
MTKNRIIISGGGTAGHIFPALSIAEELNNAKDLYDILFVGAKNRMEMTKVPLAGYKIKGLWIDGLQRKFSLRNIMFPLKLVVSLIHSFLIIVNFRPKCVIGTGGFASGPIVFMAALFRIPTLIHEQNSFPGITNRLLGKVVDKICVSYEGMERYFPHTKIIKTGNPIRKALTKDCDKKIAQDFFDLSDKKITILIIGGSLGAEPINRLIKKNLHYFSNYQLIWQTGKKNHHNYNKVSSNFENIRVFDFIDRMDFAYSVSDVVISRAGAIAIAEICFLKKATILVPSPYVSENHQMENAKTLEGREACLIVKEQELESNFFSKLEILLKSKNYREEIGKNAKKISITNSSIKIVQVLNKILKS